VGEAGRTEAAMKWICRVRIICRSMPGTEGGPILIPFDDFSLNSELETLRMQWKWDVLWERL